MLVRKLVHSLRKTGSNDPLCDRAVDYLKRTGIAGSILRTVAPLADAQEGVSVGVRAKPLQFKGAEYADGSKEWDDSDMGFHIGFDPDEEDGERYRAACGEGESETFATLEEAKEWCQSEADKWVRKVAYSHPPAQTQGESRYTGVLDDPKMQELFSSTIMGAIAFGAQGTNPPPAGHWLTNFWDIGRASQPASASPPVAPVVGDGDRAPVENPDFWIGVVRTNAYTTDCADKTLALTNAADALTRIFAHRRLSDRRTFEYAATLREEIRDLKKAASAQPAAAQEGVSCWRLITPVAPHAWIDGLPPTRDDAEMETEKRLGWSVELAYSHPPAQTQGSSGSEAASAIQRAITTAETYSDGVTVAISMETAKTTIDALKAHLGVSP